MSVEKSFMDCLASCREQTAKMDYSRKQGYYPDDGRYNVQLTDFTLTHNTGKDGSSFFVATPCFTIIDGPQASRVIKPAMFFREDDAARSEPTVDQTRLCTLATVISGTECFDGQQAFLTIKEAAVASPDKQPLLEIQVKRSGKTRANGSEYDPSVYVNKRIK